MALELEVTNVPEGLEQFYKEQDGKFVLDVEGGVAPISKVKELQQKVEEFRTNNVSLKAQLGQQSPDKTGVDVEKLVEDQLNVRIGEMKTNYETQVKKMTEELSVRNSQLENVLISEAVKDAALKYGVLETAVSDVLYRARDIFTVKDGKAVAKDKVMDKDGNALNVTNWVQGLSEAAPHLFAKSSGAGGFKPVKGGVIPSQMSSIDRISAGLNKR